MNLKDGNFHEYLTQENVKFKIEQGSKYCKEAATIIEREDRIPENLTMEEAILKFSCRRNKLKIPFFLADINDQITGLVTLADLDKTPVKVYLFALTSELELSLLEVISKCFERYREACPCRHCIRRRRIRDGKKYSADRLEEYYYLYFEELIHMVPKSENPLGCQKRLKDIMARKGYRNIIALRNTIAHQKPLVSYKFPVVKLAETIGLIKDLTSACKRNPDCLISIL